MASVAGVDLNVTDPALRAGAAFRLSSSEVADTTVELSEGEVVTISQEHRVAVASLSDPVIVRTHTYGYFEAHEAAQRALDTLDYTGAGLALIADEGHVQWWRDEDGVNIRPILTRDVRVSGSVSLQVLGPDGQPKVQPPPPKPTWTPSLRFFRYAQATEDAFDAYRNYFLAFESILSERVTGGPGGERVWLDYALRQVASAQGLDMSNYVTGTSADSVEAFLDQQYEALRCATFHAKSHRPVLLPGTAEEHDKVVAAIEPLARLVLHLTEPVVSTRRPSSAITTFGFEATYISHKANTMRLHLLRSEGGEYVERVELPCEYVGRAPESQEWGFRGVVDVSTIEGRTFDALSATAPEGEGGFLSPSALDETFPFPPLDASGADHFQVLLIFTLTNRQLPKTRFAR
jgi:hypothetical protein